MEWLEEIYEAVGAARHPTVSLIVVMVAGAVLSGAVWWVIGQKYHREHLHPKSVVTLNFPTAVYTGGGANPANAAGNAGLHVPPDITPVEPVATKPHKPAAQPPKNPSTLTISQSDRVSTEPEAPNLIEVVIATTVELPHLSNVVIHFDKEISAWSWTSSQDNTIKIPTNGLSFEFRYDSLHYGLTPRFDPAHPLVFLVWSKQPIKCTDAETF